LANVVRFLLTSNVKHEFIEKLTEQITEKVTCDIAQKMKRGMAKSVDAGKVIDLSMVDEEELENKK